jgi:hypothetical protein
MSGFLGVYEGSNCNSGLRCVTQEYYGDQDLRFFASSGVVYHVFAGGASSGSIGEYTVTISETSSGCPEAPTNDSCEDAAGIGFLPFAISGNYALATPPEEAIWEGVCELYESEKAVWYTLETPESTCVQARLVDNDASLVVMSASECGSFTCIGTSSFDENGEQTIQWDAQVGVLYFVVVRGYYGSYASEGAFDLEVAAVDCVMNDECDSATPITELPFVDVTNSALATRDNISNSSAFACNQYPRSSRSLWYYMSGMSGTCVSVYVWSDMSLFLGIYTGDSCQTMSCYIQEQYGDRAIHFMTEVGRDYHIVVSHENTFDSGEMAITVAEGLDCPVAIENGNCTSAMLVDSVPFEISQSTELAPPNEQYLACGVWTGRKMVWYEFSPEETSCISAEIESTMPYYYDLRISVFEASSANCTSSLSCMKEGIANYRGAQVSFKAEAGRTYFLVVSDEAYRAGTPYKLSLLESACVENDSCGTAATLAVPYHDESSTEFSSVSTFYNSSAYDCSYLSSNVGYNYYKLDPGNESACLEVSLYTRFEGVVAILQGDDCASLSCLAQNTVSASYDDAKVSFVAKPNTVYTVVVGPGYGGPIGSYLFTIEVCFVLVSALHTEHQNAQIPRLPTGSRKLLSSSGQFELQ